MPSRSGWTRIVSTRGVRARSAYARAWWKSARCDSRMTLSSPPHSAARSRFRWSLYFASTNTLRPGSSRRKSGERWASERTPDRQTIGRRVSPCRADESRPPSRAASATRNDSTHASHMALTVSDHGSPSSAVAPPRPRSSRTHATASSARRSHSERIAIGSSTCRDGRRAGPGPSRRRRSPIRSSGCRNPTRASVQRSAAARSGLAASSEHEYRNVVSPSAGHRAPRVVVPVAAPKWARVLVLDRHEPAREPLDHRRDARHDRPSENPGRHLARGARHEREPAGLWLDIEADVGGAPAGCAVRLAELAVTSMWIYAAVLFLVAIWVCLATSDDIGSAHFDVTERLAGGAPSAPARSASVDRPPGTRRSARERVTGPPFRCLSY